MTTSQLSLAACVLCISCVSFTDAQVTRSIPRDIADRNTFMPTATWKRHLSELGGSILYEMTPGSNEAYELSTLRVLKSGTRPVETIIPPDEGVLLEVLIDSSASANLKAIGVGNAGLSAKEKMSFTYRDVSEVFIPSSDWDRTALSAEAKKPMPKGVTRRYYIQAALLSGIQRKKYSEVSGTFKKAVDGTGIGADGEIYSSSDTFSQDYAIHLTLRDLAEFADPLAPLSTLDHFPGEPGSTSGLFVPQFDLK